MSDPLVTVTLGRSGRVVKRSGMRFVRSDRVLSANKGPRVDHAKWRPGDKRFKGFWIARNDLRVKLMRKRYVDERRKRYLREKISKAAQLPANGMLRQKFQFKGSSQLRQYSSNEILDDMLPEHPVRRYYTSQTTDGARIRSPDQVWAATRGLSPPRNFDERCQVPAIRATNVARAGWYFSKEVDACRQTAVRATAETAKPVTFTGGNMLQNSHMGVETLTIPGLLHSLGLRKYAVLFRAEEVDMATLKQMGDKDLKELGLPLGPRKKILLALQPGSEQYRP